jgi:hypothetical protein
MTSGKKRMQQTPLFDTQNENLPISEPVKSTLIELMASLIKDFTLPKKLSEKGDDHDQSPHSKSAP